MSATGNDDTSTFFAGSVPRIIAHRGLAGDGCCENTIPAFVRAMDAGATHVETDVHVTADGVAVLSHDPDLRRIVDRPEAIADLTLTELQRIELAGGAWVPALLEALTGLPDVRFNIDIKTDAAVGPTVHAVQEAEALPRVLVTSFSERRRSEAVSHLPGVATSASSRTVISARAAHAIRWRAAHRRSLRGIHALQVPERYGGVPIVTPSFIEAAHSAGVEVHVWTVNEAERMERLVDCGVDGLVTDRCDVAAALVAERS